MMLEICRKRFSKFPYCDNDCPYAHTKRCEITKTDERLKELEHNSEIKKQRKNLKELENKKASLKLLKEINEKYYKNKLSSGISALIRHSLKGNKNGSRWEDLVGYTLQDLISHLKKQFKKGMTWENYGKKGWEIDHKIPISFFDFSSYKDWEFKYCWSLNNLQPLWMKENILKGAKIE